MKAAYLSHHYILLRYNKSRSRDEKAKLAKMYFEQMAGTIDEELRKGADFIGGTTEQVETGAKGTA